MANTLLLDTVAWDLVTDLNGNIAMATSPYALAQDAASSIRLYQGELWYDTTQGIPYDTEILGFAPSLALLKATFVNAALTVPGISSAQCFISAIKGRVVNGQVQVMDPANPTAVVAATNF